MTLFENDATQRVRTSHFTGARGERLHQRKNASRTLRLAREQVGRCVARRGHSRQQETDPDRQTDQLKGSDRVRGFSSGANEQKRGVFNLRRILWLE